MKTTSRFAIAAAASVIATSAMAADLGGNCCADLEERVAELEATTARKGNRRVALTVYGQVNEAVLWWDDGVERNAYVVTNENSRTRFGFRGDARISPEWSAGYLLEIGVRIANSAAVNQFVDDDLSTSVALDLRHSAWYIESNRLGRLWVGHTSMSTDGITEINLSNANVIAGNDPNNWAGGFFTRLEDGQLLARQAGPFFGLSWNALMSQSDANVGDGARRNLVRYVSPTFQGFTFSWSWGEDDFWDTALRYANEFNGIRVAAGIGWQQWTDGNRVSFIPLAGELTDFGLATFNSQGDRGCADLDFAGDPFFDESIFFEDPTQFRNRFLLRELARRRDVDCQLLGLSGSIMHVPTGLYAAASYGFVNDSNRKLLFALRTEGLVPNAKQRDEHWYVQTGIEKNFFGIGKSTLYSEYFHANTGSGLFNGDVRDIGFLFPTSLDGFTDVNEFGFIVSSRVDVWGFGWVQTIDAAAMDLYLGFRNYSGDSTVRFRNEFFRTDIVDNKPVTVFDHREFRQRKLDFEDFQAVFAGGIIRF